MKSWDGPRMTGVELRSQAVLACLGWGRVRTVTHTMDAAHRAAFGARLRQLRAERGLSQAAVAAALTGAGHRTTGSNVGAWERGEYGPAGAAVVRAVADALDVPPDDLLAAAGYAITRTIDDRLAALEERVARLEAAEPARPAGRVIHMRESDLGAAAATGTPSKKGRRTMRPVPPPEEDPET